MEKNDKFIGVFSLVLSIIGIVCGFYTFYGIWIETKDFNLFPGSKIFHFLFAFSTLNLDFANKFEHLEIWNFVFYTLLLVGALQFIKTKGRETRLVGFVYSVIFLNAIISFFQSTIFKLFIVKWSDLNPLQIFNSIFTYIILVGMLIVSFRILKFLKSKKEIEIIETELRKTITDTNRWQRFFHWIIDLTVMSLIFLPVIIFLSHHFLDSEFYQESEGLQIFFRGRVALYVISLMVIFIYYPISEILFGATPAKFLTESRVINSRAESPNSSTIFLRTLCRNIPFDALSFFAKRGWHDSLSETYVVKEKRTGFKTNKLLWILPLLAIYLSVMYFGKSYYADYKASVEREEIMTDQFAFLKSEIKNPNTSQFYLIDAQNYYGDIINLGFKIEKIEGNNITIKRITGRFSSGAGFSYAKNLYEQQKDTAQTFMIKKQELVKIFPEMIDGSFSPSKTMDFFNSGIQYKIENVYNFDAPFMQAHISKDDNDYTNNKATLYLENLGKSITITTIKNQNNEIKWNAIFPLKINKLNSPAVIQLENYNFIEKNISQIEALDSLNKKHSYRITTKGLTSEIEEIN